MRASLFLFGFHSIGEELWAVLAKMASRFSGPARSSVDSGEGAFRAAATKAGFDIKLNAAAGADFSLGAALGGETEAAHGCE